MWDLLGNPEDRFSHNEAHMTFQKGFISPLKCGHYFNEKCIIVKDIVMMLQFQAKVIECVVITLFMTS